MRMEQRLEEAEGRYEGTDEPSSAHFRWVLSQYRAHPGVQRRDSQRDSERDSGRDSQRDSDGGGLGWQSPSSGRGGLGGGAAHTPSSAPSTFEPDRSWPPAEMDDPAEQAARTYTLLGLTPY